LSTPIPKASPDEVDRLIEQYDPESNFRRLIGFSAAFVTLVSVALSSWHVYTAGFGLHNEIAHRAIHLSAVLGLCFLVFPRQKRLPGAWEWIVPLGLATFYLMLGWGLIRSVGSEVSMGGQIAFFGVLVAIGGLALPFRGLDGSSTRIPLRDWFFAALASSFSLYLLVFFQEIFIQRPGDHSPLDLMMGVIAIAMVIEVTRRTMGIFLPLMAVVVVLYGIFGPYLPGDLAHRGYSVPRVVAHLYKGTEGIYGIPVGVVATFVFHFVLFGIMAQLTGLGQLFVNLATIAAGRFSGGPAKVSVVSSGLFGMISGSPIANTVTTGVMTIPMMKNVGFSPRFAAGVEASASCGGQVTPPIMGAAAFIMAETLGIPYSHLVLVALVPASMHYLAILVMVHLESKRLKLKGMDPSEIPNLRRVMVSSWHLFIPLVVMVTLLLMQYTPFLAAFWGIILSIACSWIPKLLGRFGQHMVGMAITPRALVQGFEVGAKSALGIGAACACVGFVLGIMTLTGMGWPQHPQLVQRLLQPPGQLARLRAPAGKVVGPHGAPTMALPVSCASTSRCRLTDRPLRCQPHRRAIGDALRSTAIERPGVSATPCAPRGPNPASSVAQRLFAEEHHARVAPQHLVQRCGFCRVQALMPGQDASRIRPCCSNQLPTLR
jgi:TRAP-type uncharacterized transport system fused permease subunit